MMILSCYDVFYGVGTPAQPGLVAGIREAPDAFCVGVAFRKSYRF